MLTKRDLTMVYTNQSEWMIQVSSIYTYLKTIKPVLLSVHFLITQNGKA